MKNQSYNEYFPVVKLYEEISGNTIKNNSNYDAELKRLQRLIERTFGKNARVPIQLKDFYVEYFKPMFDYKTSDKYAEILKKIDKNKPTSMEEHTLLAEHFYKCLEKVEDEQLKRYLADRFLFKYSRELDSKICNILNTIETDLDLLTGLNIYQHALDLAQEYDEMIKNATKDWREKVLSQIEYEEHHARVVESINVKKSRNADGEIIYTIASEDVKKFKSIAKDRFRKTIADNGDENETIILEAFNRVCDKFVFEDNPKPIKGKTKDEVIEILMREFLSDTKIN